ncbi:MAG: branched-chain amino acid ABC transporter permease [Syntrophobacteraceae bacterium]
MQLVFNTLIAASAIVLAALSFRLVYVTARFFHFAHALTISIGGYAAWSFFNYCAANPYWAFLSAVILTGAAGTLSFMVFLRPLMTKGASPLVLLLASLAIHLIFQHTIALIFGEDARSVWSLEQMPVYSFAGGHLTVVQCWLIAFAVGVSVLMGCSASFSIFGKQQAAVAEHSELSTIFGIDVLSVQMKVFLIASAVGGGLGALVGMDLSISPGMGFDWLLPGVVALLVGGIYRIRYVVLASVMLASVRTAVIWYLGSMWQDIFIYSVLFLYLFLRPEILVGDEMQ